MIDTTDITCIHAEHEAKCTRNHNVCEGEYCKDYKKFRYGDIIK